MKKNILIAFSGMDGSGKTTLAKKLTEYLSEKGNGVFFKHAHGYTISQNSFAVGESSVKKYRWFFLLISPYMIVDSWYTHLFKYKKILKKQTLISDRYFYDKLARLMYYKICGPALAKVYLKLLPKPNISIFIDIAETSAFKRKPEYTLEELKRFRKHYLFIANQLKTPLINNTRLLKNSTDKVIQIVNHYLNLP